MPTPSFKSIGIAAALGLFVDSQFALLAVTLLSTIAIILFAWREGLGNMLSVAAYAIYRAQHNRQIRIAQRQSHVQTAWTKALETSLLDPIAPLDPAPSQARPEIEEAWQA